LQIRRFYTHPSPIVSVPTPALVIVEHLARRDGFYSDSDTGDLGRSVGDKPRQNFTWFNPVKWPAFQNDRICRPVRDTDNPYAAGRGFRSVERLARIGVE
jgi:hypothetical protein